MVSFETQFLEMMPDTITIASVATRNAQGKPATFNAGVPYRCRISGKGLSLRHQQGEEATVIFDAWVQAAEAVISAEDRVTLPADPRWSAFTDEPPILFAVARLTDEDGQHHVKLQFGWMYHRQGQ